MRYLLIGSIKAQQKKRLHKSLIKRFYKLFMNTRNLFKKYSNIAEIYQTIEGQGHIFLYIYEEYLSLFGVFFFVFFS